MKKIVLIILFVVMGSGAASGQEFQLDKLPPFINSSFDEITPVPSRDGQTLYFTRVGFPEFDHTLFIDSVDQFKFLPTEKYPAILAGVYSQIAGAPVYNTERSPFNQDVWIASGDSVGTFDKVTHPGFPLNNALPNSLVTITPDPNVFYVINQFNRRGDMQRGFSAIRRTTDSIGWSFPTPVEIKDYYTITSDVSLTMSFDGQVLILSAARFDSKEMDLYVCFREGDNRWGPPQNLGTSVNSARRETTPFLSEDNTTLFFSSNRSGNSDIYICRRLDDTWKNWSAPYKAVEPINSPSDDSQPYFNMTSGYLYFTSKRDGNSDIFRVQIAPPQPTEIEVIGRVINRKTKQPIPNARVQYDAAGSASGIISSSDGFFRMKIPKGIKFEFTPEKPGFTGQKETLLFRRDYYYFNEHYLDLPMDPLEVNAKIVLRPIYFQQSKAIILEESYPELESLAATLLEMPGLHIRVEGHTDNLGKAEDLLHLSEERADAIKVFLVQKGISGKRIETIGHGPKYPLTDNSTDELRSQNRRVEFIITKI
ncbi:MAG: OmpA family protein [Lewinellaceae bacterium]|nr:OmpA family protein [Lewinellaceae bacterium]